MDEALLQSYRDADYRVRLAPGGHATIRVGQPLPASLQPLLQREDDTWVVITAWNPRSEWQPRAMNRLAQRDLRSALRTAGAHRIRFALGVGEDGWREPSLFVTGLTSAAQEVLMRRFSQNAIVCGIGSGEARLWVNADCGAGSHGQSQP
jgi:glycine/D-amino acid oxidase-like deaminating enzyme